MKSRLARFFRRLVDILASLELPPKKGCVRSCDSQYSIESSRLKTAIRLLKESAKCFRESFAFLRAGLQFFGCYLRIVAMKLGGRFRFLVCRVAGRQPQTQISHPNQFSYLKEGEVSDIRDRWPVGTKKPVQPRKPIEAPALR